MTDYKLKWRKEHWSCSSLQAIKAPNTSHETSARLFKSSSKSILRKTNKQQQTYQNINFRSLFQSSAQLLLKSLLNSIFMQASQQRSVLKINNAQTKSSRQPSVIWRKSWANLSFMTQSTFLTSYQNSWTFLCSTAWLLWTSWKISLKRLNLQLILKLKDFIFPFL